MLSVFARTPETVGNFAVIERYALGFPRTETERSGGSSGFS